MVISDANTCGKKVGICGQAPSDHEGFAEMLVDAGIDSISLNPDSVLKVRQRLSKHESKSSMKTEKGKLHEMKGAVHTSTKQKQASAQ